VVYNPGSINFGTTTAGTSSSRSLEIEYAGALEWRIEGIAETPPHLDATYEPMYRRPGRVGYRVTVTLHADAPAADYQQNLLLRTNDPSDPIIPVLVEASIRAAVAVTPSLVKFGTVHAGRSVSRRVTIRADKPFHIQKVGGLTQGLTAQFSFNASKVHTLTLHWQPSEAGDLHHVLHVHTDLDQGSPCTVTLEGQAK
jgi:hypothetical protein